MLCTIYSAFFHRCAAYKGSVFCLFITNSRPEQFARRTQLNENAGESGRQLHPDIRLTDLKPELLALASGSPPGLLSSGTRRPSGLLSFGQRCRWRDLGHYRVASVRTGKRQPTGAVAFLVFKSLAAAEKPGRRSVLAFLVPLAGLEPARCCHLGILSPLCLPIPPQRRGA